jgi:hypothetical protein
MKYPRTPHLPQSPGGTNDDKRLKDLTGLDGHTLVFTEKIDGSNVCLQREGCFARSHAQTPSHPSFDLFKVYHARMRERIPEYLQIFGEWAYARHSIPYTSLRDYLMVFGVRDLRTNMWASWSEVIMWADELGVPTTPVLFETEENYDLEKLISWLSSSKSLVGGESCEGFVVRRIQEFHNDEFDRSVAKWVRKDHVQTPHHWKMMQIVRNHLAVERPR